MRPVCAVCEHVARSFFSQGGIRLTRAKERRRIPILQALRGAVAYAPHETTGTSSSTAHYFDGGSYRISEAGAG